MSALKPCPFCGSDDVELTDATRILGVWSILHRCKEVGALEVKSSDQEVAIRRWNARHQGQDEAKAESVEGWKLVPVEPTETMCASGDRAFYGEENDEQFAPSIYRAMIAAAPQPPHQDARDGRIAALEAALKPFVQSWLGISRTTREDPYSTVSPAILKTVFKQAATALQAKGAK